MPEGRCLVVAALVGRSPLIHRKAWRHRADISEPDHEVLASLQADAGARRRGPAALCPAALC